MTWYINKIGKMEANKTYSRQDLADLLKSEVPGLSYNSCKWVIGQSVKDGSIVRKGYNSYALPDSKALYDFEPLYSDRSLELIKTINDRFPYVSYTVFETVLMNDFLNHLIAQNTVFVQIEKDGSASVFRELREHFGNVLYKPDLKDLDLYWSKDVIIVTDLVSEAPMRKEESFKITLEKMLVDLVADKLISSTFSKAELPDVFDQAKRQYRLNQTKMLRYARRRSKEEEIKEYLKGE